MAGVLRCGLVALAFASVSVASLGPASAAVPGQRLVLDEACGGNVAVEIEPDAGLTGAVAIDGAAGSVGTAGGTVSIASACRADDRLTIRVPPAFPITVHGDGGGTLMLGSLSGPVELRLSGDVGVQANALDGPLMLFNSGAGDVHVARLGGPVVATLSGSGDLLVDRTVSAAVAIDLAGSGDARLGDGTIDALRARLLGSGDLAFNGTVGHGSIEATGSGDATIRRATGTVTRRTTGSGDIRIRSDGSDDGADAASTGAPRMEVVHGADGSEQMVVIPPVPRIVLHRLNDDDDNHRSSFWDRVVVLVLVGGAAVWWVRRRVVRGQAVSRSAAALPDHASIATLAERMEAVSRRIAFIEAAVTSSSFQLHRQFRDLGD